MLHQNGLINLGIVINELRINHELINALPEETIIQFPLIDTEGYKEYERLTPTETRASELFGKRASTNRPRCSSIHS